MNISVKAAAAVGKYSGMQKPREHVLQHSYEEDATSGMAGCEIWGQRCPEIATDDLTGLVV